MSDETKKLFKLTLLFFFTFSVLVLGFCFYLFNLGTSIEQSRINKKRFEQSTSDLDKSLLEVESFDYFGLIERSESVKNINKNIIFINESSTESKVPFKGIAAFKKLQDSIKTSPDEVKKILSQYIKTIKDFYLFVNEKNWQTLARTSNRIYSRTPQDFDFKKDINYLLGINLKDTMLIKEITANSTLLENEKKDVLTMADKLIVITNLLIEKNSEISQIRNYYLVTIQEIENWISSWKKNNTTKSLSSFEAQTFIGHNLFYLAICGMLLLTGAFGYLLRIIFHKVEDQVDRKIIVALDNIVVKDNLSFLKNKKENFRSAVKTLNEYVKKKMSFGQIFQQTIPFPCIFLDSNLNFKWCNSSFLKEFQSQTPEGVNVSWDSLKRNFNIVENDPVIEAINNNISGIYQVENENNEKFQMYVDPVDYNNQKYVVVFLFSLSVMSESVDFEKSRIDKTIEDTFLFLNETSFSEEIPESLSKRLTSSGLERAKKYFEELRSNIYKEFTDSQKEFDEASLLANGLLRQQQVIKEKFQSKEVEFKELQSNFNELKNIIIKMTNEHSVLENRNKVFFSQFEKMLNKTHGGKALFVEQLQVENKLMLWGVPSLIEFKKELKFEKNKNISEEQKSLFRNIDLFLSKFQMLLEDLQKYRASGDILELLDFIETIQGEFHQNKASMKKSSKDIEILEEQMILLLKSFYGQIKSIEGIMSTQISVDPKDFMHITQQKIGPTELTS
jgi:hypothetical protein